MIGIVSDRRRSANRYLDRVKVIPGDITQQKVDAIVTVLPQNLQYHGNVNKRIAEVAGHDMESFIKSHIYDPHVGDVYALPGFGLACDHILVTIVPNWRTEFDRQDKELLNACRKSMDEALKMGLKTIAFPPVACGGKHGFPLKRGVRLILQAIEERLDSLFRNESFEEVRIIALTESSCDLFRQRLAAMSL